MFFPYIGLFIAIPWGIISFIKKFNLEKTSKNFQYKLIAIVSFLLIAHAYGTFQRNKIWDNSISLWRDVTIKSPKNGRGLMNYGLALMAKGNYNSASLYFEKALKLTPNWGTLHTNLAILKHTNLAILNEALGNHQKAEKYFKSAATLDPKSPASYYFHARYLVDQKKYYEANLLLQKAIKVSPNHFQSKSLLSKIKNFVISPEQELKNLIKKTEKKPSVNSYLELNIKYSELKNYEKAIEICFKILELEPNNVSAYNNLCVAYNHIKKWDLAIEACEKAIKINPNFQLAKNNLNWAKNNSSK